MCQLFFVRVLVQATVGEYKGSVFAVRTVGNNHQKECGNHLGVRCGFDDLQCASQHVSRGIHRTGYHAVCHAGLYQHTAKIQRV